MDCCLKLTCFFSVFPPSALPFPSFSQPRSATRLSPCFCFSSLLLSLHHSPPQTLSCPSSVLVRFLNNIVTALICIVIPVVCSLSVSLNKQCPCLVNSSILFEVLTFLSYSNSFSGLKCSFHALRCVCVDTHLVKERFLITVLK